MASSLGYAAWCGYGLVSNRPQTCRYPPPMVPAVSLHNSPTFLNAHEIETPPKAPKRFDHLSPLLPHLISSPPPDLPLILEPWLHQLSAEDWNALIADVGRKNWGNAMHLFNILTNQSILWPDMLHPAHESGDSTHKRLSSLKMFTTLVRVLSRKKRRNEIATVLEQMKEAKVVADLSFYNTLFMSYADHGQADEIVEGLREMEAAGMKPNHETYEALIKAYIYGNTKELHKATSIVEDMIKEELIICASTFEKLINAFWEDEDVKGAEKIFALMQDAGYTADMKIVSKLMQLYGRKGNHNRARELFNMLKGLGVDRLSGPYTFLLHAYCKAGLVKEARETFRDFETVTGSKPPLVAFNMIIDFFGKHGLDEETLQYYSDLCCSGLEPNVVTYCSIISAMVNVGRYKTAEQVYSKMLAKGVQPNSHVYVAMIHCCTESKTTRFGHELYFAMKNARTKMTSTIYSTVLALYTKGQWYAHAATILKRMEKEGFRLDAAAEGLLVRGLGRVDEEMGPLVLAVEASQHSLCKLLTSLCLTHVEVPKLDSTHHDMLLSFLEALGGGGENYNVPSLYNAFLDCFWQRGLIGTARILLEKARRVYAWGTLPQRRAMEWILDVRGLSIGGSKVALIHWLRQVEEMDTQCPVDGVRMAVMTGSSRISRNVHEESLSKGIKGALLTMLHEYGSPFLEAPENPKKLQAHVVDVLKWLSQGTWKEAMSLVDVC